MKAFVVAEIASNWEGDVEIASKLIHEAKMAGANAVKFQMWRASDLYNTDHPEWEFIKKSELTFEKAKVIKKITDEIGIEFFCSAFYPEAIDFLERISVKRYKVASRTCMLEDKFSYETLLKKSETKKPVIISMGMGGDKEKIMRIFDKNDVTLCYCISEYPTKIEKINWEVAINYDGFSDHTLGISAPIVFAMLKKNQGVEDIFIEKHVKLENSKGPDASSSINTNELGELVRALRIIEKLKF